MWLPHNEERKKKSRINKIKKDQTIPKKYNMLKRTLILLTILVAMVVVPYLVGRSEIGRRIFDTKTYTIRRAYLEGYCIILFLILACLICFLVYKYIRYGKF